MRKLDGAGTGLPVAIPVAVALDQPLGGAFAMAGAGQAPNLQFHQPLGREADHLAQHLSVRAFLQ